MKIPVCSSYLILWEKEGGCWREMPSNNKAGQLRGETPVGLCPIYELINFSQFLWRGRGGLKLWNKLSNNKNDRGVSLNKFAQQVKEIQRKVQNLIMTNMRDKKNLLGGHHWPSPAISSTSCGRLGRLLSPDYSLYKFLLHYFYFYRRYQTTTTTITSSLLNADIALCASQVSHSQ